MIEQMNDMTWGHFHLILGFLFWVYAVQTQAWKQERPPRIARINQLLIEEKRG